MIDTPYLRSVLINQMCAHNMIVTSDFWELYLCFLHAVMVKASETFVSAPYSSLSFSPTLLHDDNVTEMDPTKRSVVSGTKPIV